MKKKLVLLGLGKQSTQYYTDELVRLYEIKIKTEAHPPFVMIDTDFDEINSLLPGVSTQLKKIIRKYIAQIETQEVDYLLVPNITLHQTLDQLSISPEIIHPIKLTIDKLKDQNIKRIVLYGTRHTMKSKYLFEYFSKYHITVEVPDKMDFDIIENFRNLVYKNKETKDNIIQYQHLVKTQSNKRAVVLACTELSIHNIPQVNVFDMVHIQIDEAIKLISSNLD